MPLYEFTCNKCKKVTETILPLPEPSRPHPKVKCEHCGSKDTVRKYSDYRVRIQWSRGRGFYENS